MLKAVNVVQSIVPGDWVPEYVSGEKIKGLQKEPVSDLRGKHGKMEVELRGDNTAAISLVKNNQVSPRLKHVDVSYHYIRELQRDGKINVTYVPTDQMVADGLTKPLAKLKFQQFLAMLGMSREV